MLNTHNPVCRRGDSVRSLDVGHALPLCPDAGFATFRGVCAVCCIIQGVSLLVDTGISSLDAHVLKDGSANSTAGPAAASVPPGLALFC
jgi:hypothetical protein